MTPPPSPRSNGTLTAHPTKDELIYFGGGHLCGKPPPRGLGHFAASYRSSSGRPPVSAKLADTFWPALGLHRPRFTNRRALRRQDEPVPRRALPVHREEERVHHRLLRLGRVQLRAQGLLPTPTLLLPGTQLSYCYPLPKWSRLVGLTTHDPTLTLTPPLTLSRGGSPSTRRLPRTTCSRLLSRRGAMATRR